MRKITLLQILAFLALLGLDIAVGAGLAHLLLRALDGPALPSPWAIALTALFTYLCAILTYRLFMRVFPLRSGEIERGSSQEFVYHVYLLHFLVLFHPLMRSALPVPLLRPFYQALGARLGENTYGAGVILDPLFVSIGSNCIIGLSSLIIPHAIEGERLAHYPIRIGDRVTIGALSAILADVEIGDDATVATGAVVTKGTRIGPGETWGGVPARRIR